MEVSLTGPIRSAVEIVLQKKDKISSDQLKSISSYKVDTTTIPFTLLQNISKCLQQLDSANELPSGSPVWVHELIKGSQVVVPSIAEKTDTPETIEKRKKLEAYVSNLRYRKMVKNVSTTPEQELLQEKAEMADFKSQAGMGLIAVALGIGWYIGKRVFRSDLGGIILGLVLMAGALVVETLLFSIRLSQVDMKKEKNIKKDLAREAKEREAGGFNMTPHLQNLPNDFKTQSYSLDGKELVSLPATTKNTDLVIVSKKK